MVLPLLALTWMSAVLAMTDRRSVLFQALFAVFNSAQGFVITAVHCFLRREVARLFLFATPPPPCWALASPHCVVQGDQGASDPWRGHLQLRQPRRPGPPSAPSP